MGYVRTLLFAVTMGGGLSLAQAQTASVLKQPVTSATEGQAVRSQEEIPQPNAPATTMTRRFGPLTDPADNISSVYPQPDFYDVVPVAYGFSYNRYYYRPYYAYRPYYYGGYYGSYYRPSYVYGYGYYGPAYPRYYNYGPSYFPGPTYGYGLPWGYGSGPDAMLPPLAVPSAPVPPAACEGCYYY